MHEEAQSLAKMGNWTFDPASQRLVSSKQTFALFDRKLSDGEPTYEDFPGSVGS